jgi:hypothetical protein
MSALMPPAPLLMAHRTHKNTKLLGIATFHITYWRTEPKNFKKEADRTFRCASPIFIQIAYKLGFTKRKRKYIEEETTATLKSKQTSIAMV